MKAVLVRDLCVEGQLEWFLFMFMFVCFFDILYLEVNKDFTDCKQCLLPLLWSCLHI